MKTREINYTEFLVMRHGQSVADLAKPKIFEGRLDTPLTKDGVAHARHAAAWIAANCPPHRIIASPLRRAMRTAQEVSKRVKVVVERDEGLLERNNGALAGLTKAEAKARGLLPPGGYLPHETVPGGETVIEFLGRAESFWSRLLSQAKVGQRILIVSHGQMIAMLFRCFLKLPFDNDVRLRTCDAGIHCWRVGEEGQEIVFANSRLHLDRNREEQ